MYYGSLSLMLLVHGFDRGGNRYLAEYSSSGTRPRYHPGYHVRAGSALVMSLICCIVLLEAP